MLADLDLQPEPAALDGIAGYRVTPESLREVLSQLRSERYSFEMLVLLTAVDWMERREPRFDVVYLMWSLRENTRIRLKCGISEEQPRCPSVVDLYPTADWLEREVFDMFGIRFEGHPDLKRILMPEDYPYHPLRKDFPVQGIDNAVSYRNQGGVLMTPELDVDRPPGQDRTPVDRSQGDPAGYRDGTEPLED